MPSRSTHSNTDLKAEKINRTLPLAWLFLMTASAPVMAIEPDKRMAERYASEIEYAVIMRGPPRPLPPVTVVAPSDPPPVHEVLVSPDSGVKIAGEDLVFARIMQAEANVGCKPGEVCQIPEEPDIAMPPGDSLTPEVPFGTRRNVIEL